MIKQNEQNFSKLEWILCRISGANMRLLAECLDDRHKATAIGLFVIVITLLAFTSGTFFFTESFGMPIPFALFGGLIWAAILFCIEFLLLTFFYKGKGEIFRALPRIVLAILVSFAVNEAILIRVYRGEIEAEMYAQKQTILKETRSNSVLQAKKNKLDEEINQLQTRLNNLKRNVDEAEAIKEKERGGIKATETTGKDGEGSIYTIKEKIYNAAKAKYENEKLALDEGISNKKTELAKVENEIKEEVGKKEEIENLNNGFWKRHEILFALMEKSPKMIVIYALFTFILLSIETFPITQKLMAKRSKYDKMIDEQDAIDDEEVRLWAEKQKNELQRVFDANENLANKIWNSMFNDKINLSNKGEDDFQKAIHAEILKRQKLRFFGEDEKQVNQSLGKPIHIEIIGKPEFSGTTLTIQPEVEKTATLINFSNQLNQITDAVSADEEFEMKLTEVTNSAGKKIDWHFQPLINQLNNDRIIRLHFEPDDVLSRTILN